MATVLKIESWLNNETVKVIYQQRFVAIRLELHIGHSRGEVQNNIFSFYCGQQVVVGSNIVW